MPKQKNFTPISAIEQDLKVQTAELYENTPTATPPAPARQAVAVQEPVGTEYRRPGRKKDNSIIPRRNGKLIFFEEWHNEAVEEIHWQCKIDRQDIIRTALDEFLMNYMQDMHITPEGAAIIREYVRKTHPQE